MIKHNGMAIFKKKTQLRLLQSKEGTTRSIKTRDKNIGEDFKINMLEGKLINDKMQWYGNIL
jgi:hypothetical protein